MLITRESFCTRLSSTSPCLITSWYWKFTLSGRIVSTTPPTLSILQDSRPAAMKRDSSLQERVRIDAVVFHTKVRSPTTEKLLRVTQITSRNRSEIDDHFFWKNQIRLLRPIGTMKSLSCQETNDLENFNVFLRELIIVSCRNYSRKCILCSI